MSLWRKRQILDLQEKPWIAVIEQNIGDKSDKILQYKPTVKLSYCILDGILLFAGTAICVGTFGFPGGFGLALLALYARGGE